MDYEIYKDGSLVNIITADEAFTKRYCEKNGYSYKEQTTPAQTKPAAEPTLDERIQTLEAANAELSAALDLLLSGGTNE